MSKKPVIRNLKRLLSDTPELKQFLPQQPYLHIQVMAKGLYSGVLSVPHWNWFDKNALQVIWIW
jgi:hypothetical protein